MILPIYLEPQPILTQKTNDLSLEQIQEAHFQQLLVNMLETMKNADGIGLAAPQIGSSKRVTVIDAVAVDKNFKEPLFLINAYITRKSFKKNIMEEGCLSIPVVYGTVKRPARITIKYLDQQGNKKTLKAEGLLARVIQHELDHLDGILFTDKVIEYSQKKRTKPDYPFV